MGNKAGGISPREALRQLGGAALGSALLPSALSAETGASQSSRSTADVRSMRKSRFSDKPNISWTTGEGIPLNVLGCIEARR